MLIFVQVNNICIYLQKLHKYLTDSYYLVIIPMRLHKKEKLQRQAHAMKRDDEEDDGECLGDNVV